VRRGSTISMVAGAAALLVVLGACDGDDQAAPPVTKPPEAEAPVVEPVEDGFFDGSEPTEAAYAERDRLLDEVLEGDDCGNVPADSGWPTTMVQGPDASRCLVAALRAGDTATQTFTGRTGDGGALLTVYVTRPDQTVSVARHVIDADGTASSTSTTCTPPAAEWLLGIEGTVQVFDAGGGTFCG
jgi:hypothetical protein